jgi:hypothetical protein
MRRIDKSTLRRLGVKETELGELRKTVSKSEARRQYLLRRHFCAMVQRDIFEIVATAAIRDLQAEEDARVLAMHEVMAAQNATAESSDGRDARR